MKYDRSARVYAAMRGGVVRELKPTSGQKSYWGKAFVATGRDGRCILYSYNTPIIEVSADRNKIKTYWCGYSATTMKHINDFMAGLYGDREMNGKKWWTKFCTEHRDFSID